MFTISNSFLLVLWIMSLLFSVQLAAQEKNKNLEQQYVLNNWDNTNGLPQNTVFDITTDSIGFVWFVTEEGFVRFDGLNFKVHDESNIAGLESSYFLDVETTMAGGIWAASKRDIVRVQSHQTSAYHLGDFTDSQITNIAEGSNARLWAGTNTGQLFIVENDSLKWVENWEVLESGPIISMEAQPPFIYVGTYNGLYKIDERTDEITLLPLFEEKLIRSIFITEEHELWIGTADDGVFHLSEDEYTQYTTQDGFRENNIDDVVVSSQGEVWAATASAGLYKMENSTFVPVRDLESSEHNIRSIHTSDQGMVWLGSTGSGLVQLKPADIYSLPDKYGLSLSITLPIYQHQNGDTWIGTAGNGLYRLSGDSTSYYSIDDGLSNGIILSIYGNANYIYVGTANGLNRFNLSANRFDRSYFTNDGLTSNIIQVVFESSEEEFWIATREGGLHKILNDRIEKIELPTELTNAEFLSVYEDTDNNLWFGTNGMGVLKISSSGDMDVYTEEDGLATNIVYHFYEDSDGAIWASTTNGLSVIAGDTLLSFEQNNGESFNEIYYIAEDRNGFLWMSSNSGLHRLDSNELIKAKNNIDYQFSTRLFTRNDGMPNSEANGGIFPAGWTMQNGDIWFPTVDGVAIASSDFLLESEQPVNIQFEALRFAGKEVSGEGNISIPAGVTYIEAEYTSVDFLNPNNITYSYRINELSDTWTNVENQRTFYLAIQNPGTYTLEIKAEKEGMGSAIAVQSFTVQPFIHQTWWFQFLALSILFGLGYLVNQLRYKSKRSEELKEMVDKKTKDLKLALSEKEVLFQEIHHRVKNNLALISGILQLQAYKSENDEVHNELTNSENRIQSIAIIHELLYQSESFSRVNLMNNISKLIEHISQTLKSETEVKYKLNLCDIFLNVNQAIPCTLIINEILTNIHKHAFSERKEGKIAIELNEQEKEVSVLVIYDGKGLPENFNIEDQESLGFKLINTLKTQLDGRISIKSTKNRTEFQLKFISENKKGAGSHFLN